MWQAAHQVGCQYAVDGLERRTDSGQSACVALYETNARAVLHNSQQQSTDGQAKVSTPRTRPTAVLGEWWLTMAGRISATAFSVMSPSTFTRYSIRPLCTHTSRVSCHLSQLPITSARSDARGSTVAHSS